jgi:hypothetical protein
MPDSNESFLVDIEPAESTRRRFDLVPAGELVRNVKAPDWLIPGYLEHDTCTQLVGKPACGKSLQVLDWCCCVATGTPWHGKPIKQQPAIYICGEGHNGISRRLKAWEIEHGQTLEEKPLFVSTMATRLLDDEAALEVFQIIENCTDELPGLIVIDTLARNLGGNENSTEDMSRFIEHVDTFLRLPFKACVLIVHHTGHADRDTGRGSTAVIGGVDCNYHMVKNPAGFIALHNVKMKDGETPADVLQTIKAIEMPGCDDFGNPFTGPVLIPADYMQTPHAAPLGANQKKALTLLEALSQEYGADAEPGENIWIPIDRWRKECAEVGVDRRRWHEASKALADRGLIEMEELHAAIRVQMEELHAAIRVQI